jgi:hypothetical protein
MRLMPGLLSQSTLGLPLDLPKSSALRCGTCSPGQSRPAITIVASQPDAQGDIGEAHTSTVDGAAGVRPARSASTGGVALERIARDSTFGRGNKSRFDGVENTLHRRFVGGATELNIARGQFFNTKLTIILKRKHNQSFNFA